MRKYNRCIYCNEKMEVELKIKTPLGRLPFCNKNCYHDWMATMNLKE